MNILPNHTSAGINGIFVSYIITDILTFLANFIFDTRQIS